MRILHVLDHSLPLQSGYTFRTAAILREQRARGWETVQMTTPRHGKAPAEVETAGEWKFHRTPMGKGFLAALPAGGYIEEMRATARRLEQLVAELAPDVLHAHSPVLNVLPAIRVARRHAIPVVYEVRAFWEDAAVDHGSTSEGSLRYRASRALETYALRRVDHIFTICAGLRNEIAGRGIDPARVTIIPNAVDTAAFSPRGEPDEALRRRLGLEGAIVAGFAGSFYAYEGLDLLLEALAQLRTRRPELRALLVGGGPQDAALRAQAQRLGLERDVVFTGRVPQAEVHRYYDLIDFLVYPRRRMRLTELVTPLKPLEAMAQGRVFLASDVGGHRELVRHGDTGFLFGADDAGALVTAIEQLLERRSGWDAVRARARRFVEAERTWKVSVASYESVYARLAHAKAAAR